MAKSRRWTAEDIQSVNNKGIAAKTGAKAAKKCSVAKQSILFNQICYKDYSYIVGIDTGVNTGFSVWNIKAKCLVNVETVMIHEALDMLRLRRYDNIFVRVEDARLRKYILKQKNEKAERGRAQGAGSVKRDAKIFEDFLIGNNIPHEMVAPKNNKTKVSAEYFRQLTGWEHKTSQHSRDGAMLCYGF